MRVYRYMHEGSQLGARVQGAWCEATHQGVVRMLQGKDEEKLHLLVIDGSFKIPLMKKTAATTAKQRTRWRQGGFST